MGERMCRWVIAAVALGACDDTRPVTVTMTASDEPPAYGTTPFPTDAIREGDRLGRLAGLGAIRAWRPSYGAAFRFSWNLATLGTFDYGFSEEGSGIYVNFGHMF